MGPYEILKWVGKVTYELKLPSELALVNPVFQVSILEKYIGDKIFFDPIEGLGLNYNLSYQEVSVEILDSQVKKFRNKEVPSVNVVWRNHLVEGATWKAEADIESHYPHLFPIIILQS